MSLNLFKRSVTPKRTKGVILYNTHEIKDKSKVDETTKCVTFDYADQGVAVNIYVKIDKDDDDTVIVTKAMQNLLNFDSLVIKDTYK